MSEINKTLQEKINKIYSDMSEKMFDIADARPEVEAGPYYPTLFVSGTYDDKKPGAKCLLFAVGEVENISKDGVVVKVKKVGVLPVEVPGSEKEDKGE